MSQADLRRRSRELRDELRGMNPVTDPDYDRVMADLMEVDGGRRPVPTLKPWQGNHWISAVTDLIVDVLIDHTTEAEWRRVHRRKATLARQMVTRAEKALSDPALGVADRTAWMFVLEALEDIAWSEAYIGVLQEQVAELDRARRQGWAAYFSQRERGDAAVIAPG